MTNEPTTREEVEEVRAKAAPSATFRPSEMEACKAAEAAPSATYEEAALLLPAYARRWMDAEEVAHLARILLASADQVDASKAAWQACRRAADRLAQQRRRNAEEVPAGDTMAMAADDLEVEAATTVARSSSTSPEAAYGWTWRDTLATSRTLLDEASAAMVTTLLDHAEVWDARSSRGISPRALGLAHYGREISRGRASQALAATLGETLADAAEAWHAVGLWDGGQYEADSPAPLKARGLERDTRVPTSGLASAVVITRADGRRYVVLPASGALGERSCILSDEAAAYTLNQVDTSAAYRGGRKDDEVRATLSAPSTLLPMRRPAGVGVGMTYGTTSARAGEGYAEQRPTTGGRKRKRDGGIGSAMVTGRTSYGSGAPGKAADAGARPTSADLLAQRVAAMDEADRAAYEAAERRAERARWDHAVTLKRLEREATGAMDAAERAAYRSDLRRAPRG